MKGIVYRAYRGRRARVRQCHVAESVSHALVYHHSIYPILEEQLMTESRGIPCGLYSAKGGCAVCP